MTDFADFPLDSQLAAVRGRSLVVLGALSAFGPATTHVYLPSLPQAAAAMHTSPAGIQSSLTVCLLGLAAGQLVGGPLSDSWGRRRLLIAAIAVFVVALVLCANAGDIVALDFFRLLQGGAGGAVTAICLAIVRDLYTGRAAARAYSILLAISLSALIVAPAIGGQLLRITDWRGVFLALAGLGLVFLGCGYAWVGETLPAARRAGGGFAATAAALQRLVTDPGFTGYALTGGFSFAALYAYISAAPFVFEGLCHVSPQLFSLFLALNGAGIVLSNAVNARLLRRFSPLRLLDLGLIGVAIGAVGVLIAVVTTQRQLHLYVLMAPLFLMVSGYGLTRPNATALALDRNPDTAGSAAALLGLIQFSLGAIAAPVPGLDRQSATPLGLTVIAAATLAILTRIVARRESRKQQHQQLSRQKPHNRPIADPDDRVTAQRDSTVHDSPAIDVGFGRRDHGAGVGGILDHDDSEWGALVGVAMADGWTLTYDKRNHPRLVPPDDLIDPVSGRPAGPITLSSTMSKYRGVKNAAAQLRCLGAPIPHKRHTLLEVKRGA
jgi:MFS transporter, DHA1 family, multidrug resistance protein